MVREKRIEAHPGHQSCQRLRAPDFGCRARSPTLAPYMQHGSPGSPDCRRRTLPGSRLRCTQQLSAHLGSGTALLAGAKGDRTAAVDYAYCLWTITDSIAQAMAKARCSLRLRPPGGEKPSTLQGSITTNTQCSCTLALTSSEISIPERLRSRMQSTTRGDNGMSRPLTKLATPSMRQQWVMWDC